MSHIRRDSNDPVLLALRSDLKKHFLIYFEMNDNLLAKQWPDSELVVYGSTLMRKLSENHDIKLPFWGRKASDIDIAVRTPSYMEPHQYLAHYCAVIPPLMKNTIHRGAFDVELPTKNGSFEIIPKEQTESYFSSQQNLNKLGDEFVISKKYTKEEAVNIMRKSKHPHLAEQVQQSDLEEYYADTIISIQPCPPPMLLGSRDFLPDRTNPEHRIDLKRDNRLNLLASKICRALYPQKPVKPTDFIDFFNLMHAHPQLFNFDPNSPDNDFDHLRCAIVAHMAGMGMHRLDDKSSNLMRDFSLSEENIQTFCKNYEQVISTEQPIHKDEALLFIKTGRDLVFHAFGYWGDNTNVRLEDQFTLNEKNFLAGQHGYSILPGGFTKGNDGNFFLDVDLLKQDHPKTFERYPTLEHNLKNYYEIVERIRANRDKFDDIRI